MSAIEFPPKVVEAVARALATEYTRDPRRAPNSRDKEVAAAILRALRNMGVLAVPDGCAVVPLEPTQEQLTAAFERDMGPGEDLYRSIYRAMVAAALCIIPEDKP